MPRGNVGYTTTAYRLGETRMFSCGLTGKIIRYGHAEDIDVQFSDGAIARHRSYQDFKRSRIAHPTIKSPKVHTLKHGWREIKVDGLPIKIMRPNIYEQRLLNVVVSNGAKIDIVIAYCDDENIYDFHTKQIITPYVIKYMYVPDFTV